MNDYYFTFLLFFSSELSAGSSVTFHFGYMFSVSCSFVDAVNAGYLMNKLKAVTYHKPKGSQITNNGSYFQCVL